MNYCNYKRLHQRCTIHWSASNANENTLVFIIFPFYQISDNKIPEKQLFRTIFIFWDFTLWYEKYNINHVCYVRRDNRGLCRVDDCQNYRTLRYLYKLSAWSNYMIYRSSLKEISFYENLSFCFWAVLFPRKTQYIWLLF